MRQRLLALVLGAPLAALAESTAAVSIDWIAVGNAGNAADAAVNCVAAGCGSVGYAYYISRYELTNAQYAEFLNTKAASDPLGLYNTNMGSNATFGGITQGGVSGSYTYTVKAGFAGKPVTYVSFYDALRFSNWLHNGQGSGNTETGAYTLLGGTPTSSNGATVARNLGAITFLPSENEWYKAAYYDAASTSFFDYPTGTNLVTGCVAPGSETGNSANCSGAGSVLTNVGAYALSESPYGTFDQGGNVSEWNEQIVGGGRESRGGNWNQLPIALSAPNVIFIPAVTEDAGRGFRVASLVPEPGTGLLVTTGLLALADRRKRPAKGL